ncbi:MAG TPA: 3-dehydroquinate synthase II [bacterium]|nr:3-dehydroquinate synthase II [bacterium]
MKLFWMDVRPWDKKKLTTALESGADAVVLEKGDSQKARELGLITTVAEDGDLKLGEDVVEISIRGKSDEEEAARLGKSGTVIVGTSDWTVIPLENLVAQADGIIAKVENSEDARMAATVLEKGAKGVLLKTDDLNEIKKTAAVLKREGERIGLVEARITGVRQLGMGDRVCIDTCTNMDQGQGMLVGNAGSAMLLVHSESIDNPYVAARPFRVNAGAVHAYLRVPGGRTRYLSELSAGDDVLVVGFDGQTESAIVGRSKVERRPLMLIEAEVEKEDGTTRQFSLVLQNAETIRLVAPGGEPISVVALKPGDRVLAYVENAARHFGMKIEETITEK